MEFEPKNHEYYMVRGQAYANMAIIKGHVKILKRQNWESSC